MKKAYSKTRDDLVIIVDELIKKFGGEYATKLIKLEQGNDLLMFVGKMQIGATYAMIRRMPKDYENPEGLERGLNGERIKNIVRLAKKDSSRYSSPNAVVIALQNVTSHARIEAHPTEKDMFYYKVDLNKTKEILEKAKIDKDGYIENEENVYVGVLVDGLYRTAGLYEAGKVDFEVPVTVYIDLPRSGIANVFEHINKYQDMPSTAHTLAMEVLAETIIGKSETEDQIN